MNLPNALTLGRIFLVPLLVVVLLTKFEGPVVFGVRKEFVGAAIFGLASLTDWLDGYLARSRQQVTALGQLMDPLADKLLITAALVSLVQMDLAPAWMVAVVLGREFAITVLRSLAHSRGVAIPASPLGKFKMASQVTAVLLLILGQRRTAAGPDPWPDCVVGGGPDRGGLGGGLLPPLQSRADRAREQPGPADLRPASAVNSHQVSDVHRVD